MSKPDPCRVAVLMAMDAFEESEVSEVTPDDGKYIQILSMMRKGRELPAKDVDNALRAAIRALKRRANRQLEAEAAISSSQRDAIKRLRAENERLRKEVDRLRDEIEYVGMLTTKNEVWAYVNSDRFYQVLEGRSGE